MANIRTIAKYPFLNEAKKYVKENNFSIDEILENPLYERARLIGTNRLDNSLTKSDIGNRTLSSENDCIMELLSYPIARMIAVCINDFYFIRRYALGESVRTYKNLLKEDKDFLIDISKEFEFDVKYLEEKNEIRIHFTDYLHYAPTRYKSWKMVNRDLKNGYILVDKKGISRLIQEALRFQINEDLKDKKCNNKVYKVFSSEIKRIRNRVNRYRKKIKAEPIGEFDVKKLPPCMKEILGAIQSGENVPHMGRFALVAFFNSLKLDTNQILKIFSSAPDFAEDKTRYQVEHITGDVSSTSYAAPGCDKMRTYGLCPVEKRDRLCKKVKHPLGYYRAKWRKKSKKK
ncbi:MAG: DNA primase large subunit PriL [Candidatus Thermoplasmatota archaeon]